MVELGPYKKFSRQDALFFAFLFVLCLVGTIGLMWFFVGIENGNRIMKAFLQALLNNAVGIVCILLVFNGLLAYFYSKRK